jgi:hypothetical protein
MRILAIISAGEYGQRHVDNVRDHSPPDWTIETWQAPAILPPIVDYPEDYVPEDLPPADLILSFAENKGVAELLPDVARVTGARSVLAAIDSEAWLPRGLARQLRGWLEDIDVACVTPKPLCSLTETHYRIGRGRHQRIEYDDPLIAEFARHFGQPDLRISARTLARSRAPRFSAMRCVAALDTSRSDWWAFQQMMRSKKQGCCTTTILAWPAWVSTLIMGTP